MPMSVPLVLEMSQALSSEWHQSLADLLSHALVVTLPQVQPHRAPAAPMFSRGHVEFGRVPEGRAGEPLKRTRFGETLKSPPAREWRGWLARRQAGMSRVCCPWLTSIKCPIH